MGDEGRSGSQRDPCDDTGPIPALAHGELDRADDLRDSSDGEAEEVEEEDVTPAFDELAAELEGPAVGDGDGDGEPTRAQPALPRATVAASVGEATQVDPFSETADPDAILGAGRDETARVTEVTATTDTDRLAGAARRRSAVTAREPVGLEDDLPATGATGATGLTGVSSAASAAPAADAPGDGAPRPGGDPGADPAPAPRPATPAAEPRPGRRAGAASPKLRALTALAAAAPSLFVLALVALGAPQTALRRWSGSDRLEPNDAFARAAALEPGSTEGLSSGGGDIDWFALEVPPGQAVVVDVMPQPTGPGGASLHTLDGQRVAVAGRFDSRLIHAAPGPGPLPLRLCVWGPRPDYEVALRFVAPAARYEPNDVALGAPPLPVGRAAGLTCNGADWFRVTIPAHHGARARVERGPAGLTAGWSSDAVAPVHSGLEVSARPVPHDRVALLCVAGATGPYDLTVDLEAPTSAAPEVARLEAGEYPRLTAGGQDEWRLDLAGGQQVEVVVRERRSGWILDVELLDTHWKPIGASRSHDVEGGAAVTRLRYVATHDEELILRVTGPPDEYSLTVWTGQAAAPARGPGQSAAHLGAPTPTDVRVIGRGLHADQVTSDESWYSIEAAAGQQVSVATELQGAEFEYGLELFDDLGERVGEAKPYQGAARLDHVAARTGRLLLRVTTYGRQVRYSLLVSHDGDSSYPALTPGHHEGLECAGDSRYSVAVPGGRRLVVELAFDSASGDLDLQLLGPDGGTLAASESLEDRERVEYVAAFDETLTVRVHNARNRHDVEVRLEEP